MSHEERGVSKLVSIGGWVLPRFPAAGLFSLASTTGRAAVNEITTLELWWCLLLRVGRGRGVHSECVYIVWGVHPTLLHCLGKISSMPKLGASGLSPGRSQLHSIL